MAVTDAITAETIDLKTLQNLDLTNPEQSAKVIEKIVSHVSLSNIIKDIVEIAVVVAIVVAVFFFIDRATKHITKFMHKHNYDAMFARFLPLISKLSKVFVVLFILLVWGNIHGFNLTSIIAGIGIGGLAIGFAAKETIADVFGTIVLIADRSFKIGDYIMIDKSIDGNALAGCVEDINFRSSKIRHTDGSVNSIPNHILASSIIKNVTMSDKKMILEYIDIVYDTPTEKVKEALDICRGILNCNLEINNNYQVELNSLSSPSLKIMVKAFTFTTNSNDYQRIKGELLLEIFDKFNTAQIEFAYNTQTLYLKK